VSFEWALSGVRLADHAGPLSTVVRRRMEVKTSEYPPSTALVRPLVVMGRRCSNEQVVTRSWLPRLDRRAGRPATTMVD
jgi:hypothetical protein